jgi:hypothetical protein
MFNISSFLEKFSKNLKSTELQKEKITYVIKNISGMEISNDSIEIKNSILYIKSSPALKNKLFIYKSKILEGINSDKLKITDIL